MITRRALLASAALLPAAASAQSTWPDRPVKLVVPYAAGGPTDAVARLLADRLSATAPERTIVENRAGAGALLGTEAVARAAADGGTLLFTTVVHAVHRALHGTRLSFDPQADFVPVALIGVVPQVIIVPPDSPVRDVPGLIAYLRAEPRSYGSSGLGGSSHLGVELFKSMTGTRADHVPYRGTGPAMIDLLAGRIALMMDSVVTATPQIRSGAVRGIATTAARRSEVLADLPTVGETVAGFEATTWNAVLAPKGTANIEAISTMIWRALGDTAPQARLAEFGVQVPPAEERNPAAAARFIAGETAKWDRLIRDAKITVE